MQLRLLGFDGQDTSQALELTLLHDVPTLGETPFVLSQVQGGRERTAAARCIVTPVEGRVALRLDGSRDSRQASRVELPAEPGVYLLLIGSEAPKRLRFVAGEGGPMHRRLRRDDGAALDARSGYFVLALQHVA